MNSHNPAFRTVVLDVDSTLSGIEGIDWLAEKRGRSVAREVASLTERAMSADIRLEDVYARRLELVQPTRSDVEALAAEYVANIAPGAREAIGEWTEAGVRTVLVSGGLKEAITPLAEFAGLDAAAVNAVSIYFDDAGGYAGFDASSPLSVATGKRDIVAALHLPPPVVAVGDGSTDVAMQDVTHAFAAFTGFTARPSVLASADFVAASFDDLRRIVAFGSL